VGNGIAINVQIDDIHMPQTPQEPRPDNIKEETIRVERVAFIKPKESAIVTHETRLVTQQDEFPPGWDALMYLAEKHAEGRVFDLIVKFDDIEGRHYGQNIKMGQGGTTIGPVKPSPLWPTFPQADAD
jgi:hypothetical protein